MFTSVSRCTGAALAFWIALAASPALAADDTYDLHVIIPLTGGGAFLGKAEQAASEAINS